VATTALKPTASRLRGAIEIALMVWENSNLVNASSYLLALYCLIGVFGTAERVKLVRKIILVYVSNKNTPPTDRRESILQWVYVAIRKPMFATNNKITEYL
jgi:hypothetical protein